MKIQKYLEQNPYFLISQIYENLYLQVKFKLQKQEISFHQGLVLVALFFDQDKNINIKNLVTTFKTSKSNMSHMVSYLEEKKWLKRKISAKDARLYELILTEEGRKKAIILIKIYNDIQDKFEEDFSKSEFKSGTKFMNQVMSINLK